MNNLLISNDSALCKLFQAYQDHSNDSALCKLFQAYQDHSSLCAEQPNFAASIFVQSVQSVLADAWLEGLGTAGYSSLHKFAETDLVLMPPYEGHEAVYGGKEYLLRAIMNEMAYQRKAVVCLLDKKPKKNDQNALRRLEELGFGAFITKYQLRSAIYYHTLGIFLDGLKQTAAPAMEAIYAEPWVFQRQQAQRNARSRALHAQRLLDLAYATPRCQRTFAQERLIKDATERNRRMAEICH
jgi:hypothetical protein